jgi:hypothetical protein
LNIHGQVSKNKFLSANTQFLEITRDLRVFLWKSAGFGAHTNRQIKSQLNRQTKVEEVNCYWIYIDYYWIIYIDIN